MANRPDINNIQRSIRTNRILDAKVLKMFRVDKSMSVKDAYILALQYATRKVELDSSDYERIAIETKEAKKKGCRS